MATIQIARLLRRARIFATAGSELKRQICRDLGAEIALDYRSDWVAPLLAAVVAALLLSPAVAQAETSMREDGEL